MNENQNSELNIKLEDVGQLGIIENSFFNRFLYIPLETIFVYLTILLSGFIIFTSIAVVVIWNILTSKEAIKVYVVMGKILFFVLVAFVFILEAINKSNKSNRRGRY